MTQTRVKPLSGNVHAIDPSAPRAGDVSGLRRDPLTWLARARRRHGDVCVIDEHGPLLSRARDCAGVIAVFGAERHRAVLTDTDRYAQPIAAAQMLDLPAPLLNLDAGLHGMRGEAHAHDQHLLGGVLAQAGAGAVRDDVAALIEAHCARWRRRSAVRLLDAMRVLSLSITSRVLFGDAAFAPAVLLDYSHLLRAATDGQGDDADVRAVLIRRGLAADAALRAWRRAAQGDGALARLAQTDLGDDAFVAHANAAFTACYEPIAIALTWLTLLLSQRAGLRAALRETAPDADDGLRHGLVERVVDEALRVLPPNALIVRVSAEPADLMGVALPRGCEVVLSPFLAHRDPQVFPQPRRFSPGRWLEPRPSPFDYLPFGAGGHACVGRALALRLLGDALTVLVRHADIVLAGDQAIDWRAQTLLLPASDPVVRFRGVRRGVGGGAIFGGLLRLVDFKEE